MVELALVALFAVSLATLRALLPAFKPAHQRRPQRRPRRAQGDSVPRLGAAPIVAIVAIIAGAAVISVASSTKRATVPVYSISLVPLLPTATTQLGATGTANYQLTNSSTGTTLPLYVNFVTLGCIGGIGGCMPPQSQSRAWRFPGP